MARAISAKATPSQAGIRLDAFLCEAFGEVSSRSQGARACGEDRVLVNGELQAKSYAVKDGDLVILQLEDEQDALAPDPIELDIRYEDDDLLVLSKPAGLITHPSADHHVGTLAGALLYRYGWDGLCNVQGERDRPGIVHRLDGDTSGLMLAAKTDDAGCDLMEAIAAHEVDRRYLALVHGVVAVDTGMVDVPIQRSSEHAKMEVGDGPSARDAITTFSVLERFEPGPADHGYTFVECKLFTGRTHQIRVHMQYIKHPVVGDATYTSHAPRKPQASLGLDRQFLHSYSLAFEHPLTGNVIQLEDGLPEDLDAALSLLGERSCGITERAHEVYPLIGKELPCASSSE